jgi:hypothetical protein
VTPEDRPLTAKLGIKGGSRVLVTAAPSGFDLGWPHDVRPGPMAYDVVLLFCQGLADLDREWAAAADRITVAGALWVAWPKRSSRVPTDLSDDVVRSYALDHGLVDVKVCAVDSTWSALKMVRRKADRD